MSKSSYPLTLPQSVKEAARRLAKADGVSLNQFIAAAVAEKVGTLNAADKFLKDSAGASSPSDMLPILGAVPNSDPLPGDEVK